MVTLKEIYDRLISSGLANKNSICGCSDDELKQLLLVAGGHLPDSYISFMSMFGKGAGKFLRDIKMFYPEVLSLNRVAREIVYDENEFRDDARKIMLPLDSFVFAMRQGDEQFMFFEELCEDPFVHLFFVEHENISNLNCSFLEMIDSELKQAELDYKDIRGTQYDF